MSEDGLAALARERVLSKEYTSLAQILRNKEDTYNFFDCLDKKFNGDLFAADDCDDPRTNHRSKWNQESHQVTDQHLDTLADFIDGHIEIKTGQRCLWEFYSFDVIPLEFISSIYEEFVTNRSGDVGVYYTPPHLVDFLLDRVLPWKKKKWDLKILDPACGSGVFLVKAYQRLVHRWKNAHPGEKPRIEILRRLLEENLFGVDVSHRAVRVASFSLYLAMCDEIDPMYLWERARFPRLRDK
ncbi:MAG: N-6 DNA methylase, partial [bacterium]